MKLRRGDLIMSSFALAYVTEVAPEGSKYTYPQYIVYWFKVLKKEDEHRFRAGTGFVPVGVAVKHRQRLLDFQKTLE